MEFAIGFEAFIVIVGVIGAVMLGWYMERVSWTERVQIALFSVMAGLLFLGLPLWFIDANRRLEIPKSSIDESFSLTFKACAAWLVTTVIAFIGMRAIRIRRKHVQAVGQHRHDWQHHHSGR